MTRQHYGEPVRICVYTEDAEDLLPWEHHDGVTDVWTEEGELWLADDTGPIASYPQGCWRGFERAKPSPLRRMLNRWRTR